MEFKELLKILQFPFPSNRYILLIINIINSPFEYLDIEIFDKFDSSISWVKVNILVDETYCWSQTSIPKLWITNIFPSLKVKDVGYLND